MMNERVYKFLMAYAKYCAKIDNSTSSVQRDQKPSQVDRKPATYFEASTSGFYHKYESDIRYWLSRGYCSVELVIAISQDAKEISLYGSRPGSAGGRNCNLIHVRDRVISYKSIREGIVLELAGNSCETRRVGKRQVLYYANHLVNNPATFIQSIKFLEV